MSRPPTPLSVLEGRGAIKKNPQRYRERMARAQAALKAGGMGEPPSRWAIAPEALGGAKAARLCAIWEEFAPSVPSDTPMKRALMELFCEAMDKFRTSAASMRTSEKAYLMQLAKTLGQDEGGFGGGRKQKEKGGEWQKFA